MTEITARQIVAPDVVNRWGTLLRGKFAQYESDRKLTELKWARNARQVLGIYDPDIELKLDPNRSRAYPKLTRVKCVSMLSRLMNLLFQDSDKPWAVEHSPVPNIEAKDLDPLLQALDDKAKAEGREPTNDEIEAAICALAQKRADRLELEIHDQLRELGGNRTSDYVALCRKVLMSGIQYGCGILKGPFIDDQQQRRWKRNDAGKLVSEGFTAQRPRYEFVSIWDYYPDMSAKTLAQMDGQFTRMVMSRAQVVKLKKRSDFLAGQLDRALEKFGTSGNYKRRPYETEVRAMGTQVNVTEAERGKYELIVWEGYVSGKDLAATGENVTEAQLLDSVRAEVWMIDDIVVKANIDPWVTLMGDEAPKMFHHFIFEDDESTLLGNALPNIMRDSQMNLCATVRMALDNASIACGLQLEINTSLLSPNQDVTSSQPYKHWFRDDETLQTIQYPAVREIKIDSRLAELKVLQDTMLSFADQETFVGPATGGDMQKGPSEPLRTAAGASMLRGDMALPFKDVVRNFDAFTQSLIGSLIAFNKKFNKNPDLRGDFQAVGRGATSLMAKEVLGMQLDNLAQTLTDEEKMYYDMHKLAQARVRVRDLAVQDLIVDDAEATRREQAQQQERADQADRDRRMAEAEVRKLLSDALKNIAQAGKNAAGAEAAAANLILQALEKGISPNALAHEVARTGAAANDLGAASGAGGPGDGGAAAPAAAGGEGSPAGGAPGPAAGTPTGSANAGFPALAA